MDYFRVVSGLLRDGHNQKMKNAVWEFMWCVDKITTEVEETDPKTGKKTMFGIVSHGEPVQIEEIAKDLKWPETTVRNHLRTLRRHRYIISAKRADGVIILVNNSKKFKMPYQKGTSKNGRTEKAIRPKMDGLVRSILDGRPSKNGRTNINNITVVNKKEIKKSHLKTKKAVHPKKSKVRKKKELADFCQIVIQIKDSLKEGLLKIKKDYRFEVGWDVDSCIEIDRAIRIDGRDSKRLLDIAKKVHRDSFWRMNIRSGKKLRKHFDVLEVKMVEAGLIPKLQKKKELDAHELAELEDKEYQEELRKEAERRKKNGSKSNAE